MLISKKKTLWIILILVGVAVLWMILIPSREEKLARVLGVEDEIGNISRGFPYYYFDDKLVPGMTVQQVHDIIKGYEVVYRCVTREVYYYYSTSSKKAFRFEVVYDYNEEDAEDVYEEGVGWVEKIEEEDLYFRYMRGEDSDSRTINIDNCTMITPEDS